MPRGTRGTLLSLAQIAHRLRRCRNCELHMNGTRAVAGEGLPTAEIALVGEQPGHEEEKAGRPFVGPAGVLLGKALAAAGIAHESVYVTNAVKHFNFEERGRMRLHKRPRATHVLACKPWLEAELKAVGPTAIVLLGATAAYSLLGSDFRLTQRRGMLIQSMLAPIVVATWHPSLPLRARDSQARTRIAAELTSDLRRVAVAVARLARL